MNESSTNGIGTPACRNQAIDTAKGILIILVVYAHCFTDGILHDFFFSFHMPAFFVLSGITTSLSGEIKRPLIHVIKNLIRRIWVPFVFFEILGVIQYIIRFGFSQTLFGFVYNALLMQCNNIVDWFLYALFFAKLLNQVSCRLLSRFVSTNTANVVYLTISTLLLCASVLIPIPEQGVINILRTILISHGFLACGFVLQNVFRKKNSVLLLVSLAAAFSASLWNIDFSDIYMLQFGYPVAFFASAYFGTYAVIQFSERYSCKSLQWLGNNSLIIMGTHIPILLIARFISHTVAPTIWIRIADFIIILVLEIPIILLITNKAPFLIGKRGKRS